MWGLRIFTLMNEKKMGEIFAKYIEEDEIKNKPKNIEKEKLAISKMSAEEILAYRCKTRKYEDEYRKYLFYAQAKAAYEGIKIEDWIDSDLKRRKGAGWYEKKCKWR